MEQNVGRLDAYLRLSTGLLLFGLGLKSRNPTRSFLMMALGANKVAEGITRHCPLLYMLGLDTLGPDERTRQGNALPSGSGYGQLAENPYRSHPGPSGPMALEGDGDDAGDAPVASDDGSRRRLRFRRAQQPSGLSTR